MTAYSRIAGLVVAAFLIFGCAVLAAGTALYAHRIMPGVSLGVVPLGGLTAPEAADRLSRHIQEFQDHDIPVILAGRREVIYTDALLASFSISDAVEAAWSVGRQGSLWAQIGQRFATPFVGRQLTAALNVPEAALRREIDAIANSFDQPRKDIRLRIDGARVSIETETSPGRIVDRAAGYADISERVRTLDTRPLVLAVIDDIPRGDIASAPDAKRQTERILAGPLVLAADGHRFTITPALIGSWIRSDYQGTALVPVLDRQAISAYVTHIADAVNIEPVKPILALREGIVTTFVPPRPGQRLEEEKTVDLIEQALLGRRSGATASATLALPIKVIRPVPQDTDIDLSGITELIGQATTPFIGSPRNRVSNIKNGVKFLNGLLVKPGEEFSTLRALGTIDNTTGYLPELVIRGDATTPEFGGGLCQVSTTLFRAVLSAGLPVTARRSHSYRVSYYERDGQGTFIGPGLDATIYEPDLDFRFVNDTGAPILIYGYTEGDTITFQLYGTRDGRTASVQGPHLLTETAPGDSIYTQTDTLPKGTTKQVETAHPGGSAIARYVITYPDGHVASQEFKSYYRRWPARFLVGMH